MDAVADDELPESLARDLIALHRLRSQLDAQRSRRVRAFDRSKEWQLTGARTPGAWLQHRCRWRAGRRGPRCRWAGRSSSCRPSIRRGRPGAINTSHVAVVASARKRARAPEPFADIEPAFVAVATVGSPEDGAKIAQQWRDALDADRQPDDPGGPRLPGAAARRRRDPRPARPPARLRRRRDRPRDRPGHRHRSRTAAPGARRADARLADGCARRDLRAVPRRDPARVEPAETDTGIRLAPDTLRRLACDAFVYPAAVDAHAAALDMGRTVRSFTPTRRRAITLQYPTCVFPGCTIAAPR